MKLLRAARALLEFDPYDDVFGVCMFCPPSEGPLNQPPPGEAEWGTLKSKLLPNGVVYGWRRYPVDGEPHHADCPWGKLAEAVEEEGAAIEYAEMARVELQERELYGKGPAG